MAASNSARQEDDIPLVGFELPAALVRPAVTLCRIFNTLADGAFYDVPALIADLSGLDREVSTSSTDKLPSRIIDLNALANPEGSLLLLDAATAPYVHRFDNVRAYLDSPHPETREVEVVSITGVGSSALGSAALGWNLSKKLGGPVLAIVPGYGLADMVLQGLGGWFGFGLFDWLNSKSLVQNNLASIAPAAASIGRRLSASVPEAKTLHGAPIYRHGSGSSDVLHALITERASPFRLLVGHSKGALQIANAIRTVDREKTQALAVMTLGCPIAEEVRGVRYVQFLGIYDALGQLNSWGHLPEHWVPSWHTTNPWLPPAMAVGELLREVVA